MSQSRQLWAQDTPFAACERMPSRLIRLIRCALLVLVLTLQWVSAVGHHHDLSSHRSDCVACTLADQLGGGLAPAAPAIISAILLTFWQLSLSYYAFYPSLNKHQLPLAHAPPAIAEHRKSLMIV